MAFIHFGIVAVALAWVLAGCSAPERRPASAFTRSDSAGFTIVTNTASASSLQSVLTVDSQPRVRIGVEDGAEELQFSEVEGAVRVADGRIAVYNGRPREIRVFSPTGEFIRRLGAMGQGPGEFQYISRLMAGEGDTLLAVNLPYFQLLRFTPQQGYVGMSVVSPDSIEKRFTGMRLAEGTAEVLRDGSTVMAMVPASESDDGSQLPTGELFRRQTAAVWVSPDYSRSAMLGTFGDIQQMFIDVGGGRRTPVIPPSSRRRIEAVDGRGSRFCIAGNEIPEVRCVDADGHRLIIRWIQDSIATAAADIETWRTAMHANASRPGSRTSPQMVERIIAGTRIPPTVPPILGILVDTERRVLVGGPDLVAPKGWHRRRVFSPDGELLGIVDFPGVRAYDIGEDYLLGVSRNADGVEFVVLHDIKRQGRH